MIDGLTATVIDGQFRIEVYPLGSDWITTVYDLRRFGGPDATDMDDPKHTEPDQDKAKEWGRKKVEDLCGVRPEITTWIPAYFSDDGHVIA
jgi:hypothetical protein